MVRTKIICTVGPASNNRTILRKMMLAGMDVVRLNFSHGSHEAHMRCILLVRELNKKYRRRVKILGDLEGYRIRIGEFESGKPIELKKRKTAWLSQEKIKGREGLIPFDYRGALEDIRKGQCIYIDDGKIALEVIGRERQRLKAKVLMGGLLKERKGVNMPGVKIRFKDLNEKDKRDIDFCIDNDVDFIAQSFVRTKYDILKIRDIVNDNSSRCQLIAKIENREGIKNIDEIIEASDGIMVARGDMGISIPIYEVPIVQKMIIKRCNRKRRVVITATQMLESMTANHMPTRAEVADVANAVLDGSDYVMLSAETAVGRYPVGAVDMMNRIIKYTEVHKSLAF